MVKRRGRRGSAIKGQQSKNVSDESNDAHAEKQGHNLDDSAKEVTNLGLSRSKLEGLISEKSLYVKVVDIQKTSSKEVSRIFNTTSIKSELEKAHFSSPGQSVDKTEVNSGKKLVSINRVMTRSSKTVPGDISEFNNSNLNKRTRRVNKNAQKQLNVVPDEPFLSKDVINPVNENIDLKNETLLQSDEDDTCLLGDIMYEQIIEDDMEESITSELKSICSETLENSKSFSAESSAFSQENNKMDIDSEMCSQPSSSSDMSINSSKKIKESGSNLNDDTKVTSSSSFSSFASSNKAVNSNEDFSMSLSETQNIKALSFLKLDPEVEPVSSSKSDTYFEPIFSIEDNSTKSMEVDSEKCSENVKDDGICMISCYDDKSSLSTESKVPESNSTTEKSSENVNVKVPIITFEKIVTRSKSGGNHVNIGSGVKNKKRTKAELKLVVLPDQSTLLKSSNSGDISLKQPEIESNKLNSYSSCDRKDNETESSEASEYDGPLVVNRCIADETRKYMGPKKVYKNNLSNSVEASKSDHGHSSPVKNDSVSILTTEKEYESICNLSSIKSDDQAMNKVISVVNKKEVPMSPKDLIKKSYSSQMKKSVEDEDSSCLDSSQASSTMEVSITSEVANVIGVNLKNVVVAVSEKSDFLTEIKTSGKVDTIKSPIKGSVMNEQNIRRSRRSSAEKAKRFISSVTGFSKEKKESNGSKVTFQEKSQEILVESNTLAQQTTINSETTKPSVSAANQNTPEPKGDKTTVKIPGKAKNPEKMKKEIITMSSILNDKSIPMSPKDLIKKSFIAFESRTMDPPPKIDALPEKTPSKTVDNKMALDNNANDVEKIKTCSFDIPSSRDSIIKDSKKTDFVINRDFKIENQSCHSSFKDYDMDKPVKVKSRWRRTSELEMGKMVISEHMDVDSSSRQSSEDSKLELDIKPTIISKDDCVDDDTIIAQRMNSFIHIDSNEYLTERYISKETKRMVCDCTLTKEEIEREEKGCGEDCLNRLLLIECGSRCPLRKLCSNKSFVNLDYAKCKVVNMHSKGVGVIAAENIPSDHFIMEYIGEVVGPKEFRRRAKEYSKENNAHFYFMSLKADSIIDATHKGNISRFINHSCDPNAETQKWTVNGELRIGFFSKRPIAIGEEITFDYQLERYGKEAQKCYCGSANCRGWLGEDPENDETDESDEETEDSEEEDSDVKLDKEKDGDTKELKLASVKVKKERKKLPARRKEIKDTTFNPDVDLVEEIDMLSLSGVKNRKHTLTLSRLIVRAGEETSRTRLLDLIKAAATPCLRLFLDYHGLNLLWSWMVDPRSSARLKLLIMETLFILPIQNKTMLKDSKVLNMIEKWADVHSMKSSSEIKERGSTEEENSNSPKEEIDERKMNEESKETIVKDFDKNESISEDYKVDSEMSGIFSDPDLLNQASKLLEEWANLKEEFRIPRKQRVEQMKEHERQADMGFTDPRETQSYNRRRFRDRKESRFDKVRDARCDKKTEEWSDWQNQMGKMSKAERRQLFAEKVRREEREKRESEELWARHQKLCKALGVDPTQTAMYHPHFNALAFYHKSTNSWLPYQEGAESYGGDGGVVDHHQPPPHYLDYQQQLAPPNYFQQGYPPVFGQFNQAILFQPPPPPPQQYNVPPPHIPPLPPLPHQPLPQLQGQPPPYQQPPLPFQAPPLPHQGPPLVQGPILPHQGPPPFQPGPPLSHHGPPLPQQNLPPLPPSPNLSLQGYPSGYQVSPLPLQGPPPPHPALPPTPPQHIKGSLLPPPNSQGPPIPQLSPASLQSNSIHQQTVPELTSQVVPLSQQSGAFSQQGAYPQQDCLSNHMEVQHYPNSHEQVSSVPLKLPPKWKTAKDKEGRLYYYHVKKRISQWLFPYAAAAAAFNSETNSDSSSVEDSSSSSEEDDDEEEEEEDEDSSSDVDQENNVNECEFLEADVDGSGSAKKRKTKKEDSDSPLPSKKPKESNLVSTIIIPREEAKEMVGITKKKIRDNKEKVKREKARAARRQRQQLQVSGADYSSIVGSVSSKCEADTSSGPKRKIKEIFMLKMADVVVGALNYYRKHDCKVGRITSTKDFKALAKKLNHFIMVKELRHCVNVEDLVCNDNVKHKARDFIRKYMSKFGPTYVNTKED